MKRNTSKMLVAAGVILGAVFFIVSQSGGDVQLYEHVDKVVADPAKWTGRKNMQVHGFVTPGSIDEKIVDQQTVRVFRIEQKGKSILVKHAGVKPDTFKDQAETVVKGKLLTENGELVLYANEGENGIMAKCPSKYDGGR